MTADDMMAAALDEARRARDAGEVPIGAVVVLGGEIVGRGFNQPIGAGDPTAHAEIVAIRDAARAVGNYRLTGATLCVTIEPCLMCVGALVHARIGTLVYGAAEPRTGAVVSTVRGAELPGHNHRVAVVGRRPRRRVPGPHAGILQGETLTIVRFQSCRCQADEECSAGIRFEHFAEFSSPPSEDVESRRRSAVPVGFGLGVLRGG